jgi:RNA-binding protein Tab2/Atab2
MKIWQLDFYKRPLKDEKGNLIWELIISDEQENIIYEEKCKQSEATLEWLENKLKNLGELPAKIQIFRPQTESIITEIGKKLGIEIETTRRTEALKNVLKNRASAYTINGEKYDPTKLEKPAPLPLPENLWGEDWGFVSINAGDLVDMFINRPIPIRNLPEKLHPINLGLASNIAIPGIVITGGRKSLQLAQWLEEVKPFSLNYMVTEIGISGGLILEAGLVERYVLLTFEDANFAQAAQQYNQRQNDSKGLHFIIVQPDNSGMTYTGIWLLKTD